MNAPSRSVSPLRASLATPITPLAPVDADVVAVATPATAASAAVGAVAPVTALPAVVERRGALPLHSNWQRFQHLLGVLIGWTIFLACWFSVLTYPTDTAPLWRLILGALVIAPTATVAWTVHNLNIYRRKGPRKAGRPVDERYRHDWNGREVVADWTQLAVTRSIVIAVDGTHKLYRNESVAVPVLETGVRQPANASDFLPALEVA